MNENLRLIGIGAGAVVALYLVVTTVLGMVWSIEPKQFDPAATAAAHAKAHNERLVTGYTSTETAIELTRRVLNKPGGFLANDYLPPGAWLDNMPNFEEGVILQLRDFALVMRNDWSRAQSQSSEDQDLVEVQGQLQIDTTSWAFPSAESAYSNAADHLQNYLTRLGDDNPADGQFYARADNLAEWLSLVQKRLGSLTQALSQSVAKNPSTMPARGAAALASAAANQQAAKSIAQGAPITSWTKRDDVFYEARGQAWALIHLMKAVQVDFADVLAKKNATIIVSNIVQELEPSQDTIWSPMVLNGDGFGLVANHSLVMAAYLARANAGVMQLRDLLARG